jgi:hypothetical protein
MARNSSLTKVGVAFVLYLAACGGDEGPDPCPSVPPCITGSTWNATVCACISDDEIGDAAHGDGDKADQAATSDAGTENLVETSADTTEAASD